MVNSISPIQAYLDSTHPESSITKRDVLIAALSTGVAVSGAACLFPRRFQMLSHTFSSMFKQFLSSSAEFSHLQVAGMPFCMPNTSLVTGAGLGASATAQVSKSINSAPNVSEKDLFLSTLDGLFGKIKEPPLSNVTDVLATLRRLKEAPDALNDATLEQLAVLQALHPTIKNNAGSIDGALQSLRRGTDEANDLSELALLVRRMLFGDKSVVFDGPGAVGKGSLNEQLLETMGKERCCVVPTGSYYRASTAAALSLKTERFPNLTPDNFATYVEQLKINSENVDIASDAHRFYVAIGELFENRKSFSAAMVNDVDGVRLDQAEYTLDALQGPDISQWVSRVTTHPKIREGCTQLYCSESGAVLLVDARDGLEQVENLGIRDKVLAIYLWAKAELRAVWAAKVPARNVGFESLSEEPQIARHLASLETRDAGDMGRPVNPLLDPRKPGGYDGYDLVVNITGKNPPLSRREVAERVLNYIVDDRWKNFFQV